MIFPLGDEQAERSGGRAAGCFVPSAVRNGGRNARHLAALQAFGGAMWQVSDWNGACGRVPYRDQQAE